jgi:hypothetical protein
MLRMCVCMHSRFIENHLIRILDDGPLISEVVLSQPVESAGCGRRLRRGLHAASDANGERWAQAVA